MLKLNNILSEVIENSSGKELIGYFTEHRYFLECLSNENMSETLKKIFIYECTNEKDYFNIFDFLVFLKYKNN